MRCVGGGCDSFCAAMDADSYQECGWSEATCVSCVIDE